MRFQTRLIFIFLSLLMILPVFLLTSQPALAFVSHIVRLKEDINNTPNDSSDDVSVVGAQVFLKSGEYSDICGDEYSSCEKDCSHPYNLCCGRDCPSWSGVTWRTSTDSHGIATFLAGDLSNTGDAYIVNCSTHNNNSLEAELYRRISDNPEKQYPICQGINPNPWFCPDEDGRYLNCGWRDQGLGRSANLAAINTSEPSGPVGIGFKNSGKPFNIYWEWTWINTGHAQNTQDQPVLSFANNLWTSILNIFPKKLI